MTVPLPDLEVDDPGCQRNWELIRNSLLPLVVKTLPTASGDWRGQTVLVVGAAGVADTLQVCLKSATNTYSWKVLATG